MEVTLSEPQKPPKKEIQNTPNFTPKIPYFTLKIPLK